MARANQAETAAAAAAAAAAAVAPASAETRCHTREQSTAGEGVGQRPVFRHSGGDGGGPGRQRRRLRGRTGAVGLSAAVLMLLVAASILTDSSPSPEQQQQQQQQERERELSLATEPNRGNVETGADIAAGGDAGGAFAEEGEGSVLGMAASSSMWDVDAPRARGLVESSPALRYRRGLLFNNNPNPNLRGGGVIPKAGARQAAKQRPLGEHNMLHDFVKEPLDFLDLDDVQDGYLWIPVSVNKFDPSTTDPLVKMCQVNYAKYSAAPWLLPMGGLLSINSGCADIKADTVQIVRMSTLKRILAESKVPITPPTGFIFHETRCGSTLVANMLASVQTNVMWSESTGPWKVMHTCPKCSRDQIVPWLKIIMDAMSRSARHNHFYFKFQSSEDIEAVTTAFPNVPWIFIFREPVEVMMSRLGAQRIGMEGMEKEVAARVEKGMKPVKSTPKKGVKAKEATTAQQLSGLCKKAINAFEANPGKGMMVEYPHLPDGIVTTVLPMHYKVTVSSMDRQRMMDTTKMYSKVASFGKGSTTESKFTEDTGTKHDAASVAVQEAAQSFLYPDFYKLRSLSTWSDLQQ